MASSFSSIEVGVVEPVGGHGGMDYYDFSLCSSIARAGGSVTLYTCDKTCGSKDLPFEISRPYQGIYGDKPAFIRGLKFIFGSFRWFIKGLARKTQIYHFHFFHLGLLEALNVCLAKLQRACVVVTIHDVEAFKPGLSSTWASRVVYSLSDHVIAHNIVSKQEIIKKMDVPDEKVSVIRHGNYVESVRGMRWTRSHKQSLPFKILFFGQIKEVKGLDLLLEAFADALPKCDHNLRLTIAGKVWKDDFSKYSSLIDSKAIRDHVDLDIRYIPDSEVGKFYVEHDLIVLPYRKIYQSGVVLMAMSYGAPVLVSDLPGMTEVVSHAVNGFVFRANDVKDLSSKVCVLYAGQYDIKSIADAGRCHVESEYDWGTIGLNVHDLYVKLLGSKQGL